MMSIFFSILYVLAVTSFFFPVVLAALRCQQGQAPLGLKFLRMNLVQAAFLAVFALSYLSYSVDPVHALAVELFCNTLFFLLYSALLLVFPPFLSELSQTTWRGPLRNAFLCLVSLGVLIPLCLHALVWSGEERLEGLRWWLNGIYLPAFLCAMVGLFGRHVVRRFKVADPWKKTTLAGAVWIFFLGMPLYLFDAFWPLFQVKWGFVPRGANLHVLAVLTWNAFFFWRWLVFPKEGSLVPKERILYDPRGVLHRLTTREHEVAEHIVAGLTNLELAVRLGIKPGTAKIHIYHIFNKTGASSRKEFVQMFSKNPLESP